MHMNLNMPHPDGTANLNLGIKEVWSRIGVEHPGINDFQRNSLCGH